MEFNYMGVFSKKRNQKLELPKVLQPENPVNYNSVLDYLVNLSAAEYEKIGKVSLIYRKANQDAADVLGVVDEPSEVLLPAKPTDDEVDDALNDALNGLIADPIETTHTTPAKVQAPSTRINVTDDEENAA